MLVQIKQPSNRQFLQLLRIVCVFGLCSTWGITSSVLHEESFQHNLHHCYTSGALCPGVKLAGNLQGRRAMNVSDHEHRRCDSFQLLKKSPTCWRSPPHALAMISSTVRPWQQTRALPITHRAGYPCKFPGWSHVYWRSRSVDSAYTFLGKKL